MLRAYGFPFITILLRDDNGIRSSPPLVFLGNGALKTCSKFKREHSCCRTILVKLQRNFIEIALRHRCSPVNLLHIFDKPTPINILYSFHMGKPVLDLAFATVNARQSLVNLRMHVCTLFFE